ncbi:MAG: hypothetical protein WAN12_05365 [Candidatus Acidiferrum sp.]
MNQESLASWLPRYRGLLLLLLLVRPLEAAEDRIKIEVVSVTESIFYSEKAPVVVTMYEAKVILPDGSHASLICSSSDRGCGNIEPFAPEKMDPDSTTSQRSSGKVEITTRNLGYYWAKRKGNELFIYGPRKKVKFQIVGSWK